jgi:hypothetical protein
MVEEIREEQPVKSRRKCASFFVRRPLSPRDTITTRHVMARPMASTSASKTVVAGTVRQLAACVTFLGSIR